MRITRFEVEGFRSIRKLVLEPGEVAVFYGPNGSGKSNVLAAIDRFWRILEVVLQGAPDITRDRVIGTSIIGQRDFNQTHSAPMTFAARVVLDGSEFEYGRVRTTSIDIAIAVGDGPRGCFARMTRLDAIAEGGEGQATWHLKHDKFSRWHWSRLPDGAKLEIPNITKWMTAVLSATLGNWLFVPEIRGGLLGPIETETSVTPLQRVAQLALSGHFEEAAFLAKNSPDLALEERLDVLRKLLQSAPLNRPDFRPAIDNGRYLLQEIIEVDGRRHAIPLDLAGLGVRQLYAILGAIVLSGASMVAIEEPEAHLHERTTALQLRQVLRALVPGTVSQLFVATHSTVFDLDPTGYFDVRLDPVLGTVVERRTDLVDLDLRHLYRPGPARHALMDALRRAEPDRVVAHRPGGAPVKASEMIEMLVVDDPDALAFLDSVTRSAVRAVTLTESSRG